MSIETDSKDVIYWLGSASSLEKVLTAQKAMVGAHFDDDDEDEGRGLLSVSSGIATVTIHGRLTSEDSFFNKFFGITSYNEIRNAIVEAVEDEDVDRILLDIDSPGGDAKGVSELSEFIKLANERKPIDTYVSGSSFSAAYWLASASDTISGPKMSEAGSIGVIAVLMEMTELLKDQGIRVRVFRAGKYKALGNPFEKLTDAAAKIIQGKLGTMEGFFLDAVSENRSIPRESVKSKVGEGRTFFAEEAVENGLMDEIIAFDELFSRLVKAETSNSAGRQVLNEDTVMPNKQVLSEQAAAALATGASQEEVNALSAQSAASDESKENSDGDPIEQLTDEIVDLVDTALAGDAVDLDAGDDGLSGSSEEEEEEEEEAEIPSLEDNTLITHLKDENKSLRATVSELTPKAEALNAAQAQESALKIIVNEYVGNMCVALGATPLDLSTLDSSTLLAQYDSVRAKYTTRFRIVSSAEVSAGDKKSASSGDDRTPVQIASVKANKI